MDLWVFYDVRIDFFSKSSSRKYRITLFQVETSTYSSLQIIHKQRINFIYKKKKQTKIKAIKKNNDKTNGLY